MASIKKTCWILGLGLSVVLLTGSVACQKKAAEDAAAGQIVKPLNAYEGTVKVAFGKYLYLPSAKGFDIAVQGADATAFVGKDVKITGELLLDKPSIFRADAIDVKDASGAFSNAFTRTQDLVLEDYIDSKAREAFGPLAISGTNKPEEWEGKGTGKVYGKLSTVAATEGGAQKETIIMADGKGKEIGQIVIDKFTDYARYYLKKLRLYDEFWFYLNIKDSVDKNLRARTKELFHADVVMTGLF